MRPENRHRTFPWDLLRRNRSELSYSVTAISCIRARSTNSKTGNYRQWLFARGFPASSTTACPDVLHADPAGIFFR